MIDSADIATRLLAAADAHKAEAIDFASTTGQGQWNDEDAYRRHLAALTSVTFRSDSHTTVIATAAPGHYAYVASSLLDGLSTGDKPTDDYLFVYADIRQDYPNIYRLTWPEPTEQSIAEVPAQLAKINAASAR